MIEIKDLKDGVWYWTSKGYHLKFDAKRQSKSGHNEIIWMSEFAEITSQGSHHHFKSYSVNENFKKGDSWVIRKSTRKELRAWSTIELENIDFVNIVTGVASSDFLDIVLQQKNKLKTVFI